MPTPVAGIGRSLVHFLYNSNVILLLLITTYWWLFQMADLSVKQLAKKLNVSEVTARKMINAGAIKSYRLGPRTTRIPEEELKRIRSGN